MILLIYLLIYLLTYLQCIHSAICQQSRSGKASFKNEQNETREKMISSENINIHVLHAIYVIWASEIWGTFGKFVHARVGSTGPLQARLAY